MSIEKAPAAMSPPPRLSPERPPQAKSRSSPARSPRADTMEDYFKFSEIKRQESLYPKEEHKIYFKFCE